jgi:ectoine hydroxylase-related dioxygenase (phytanoyl-CoA dioxygenase family)
MSGVAIGAPTVTEADRRFYRTNGYYVSPKVLSDARIAKLRKEVERIYAGDFDRHGDYALVGPYNMDDPVAVKTVLNTWWVNDEVARAAFEPAITAIAAALMDAAGVRLWQDQVIWKPAAPDPETAVKGHIGYHQDYDYWQDVATTDMLTANIALQDTDASNGAMRVLAGSQRLGLIDEREAHFFAHDLDAVRRKMTDRSQDLREEVVALKAGQVSFHNSLTLHGSGPNLSTGPRLAIAIAYMPDGARYRSGHGGIHHPNSRGLGPRPAAAAHFDGPCFPKVFPPPEGGLA